MGGSKNPNFDLVVKMGRNQRHCEDYQILIPMTAYGSKLELKRPRYRENGDSTPIDATLTSEITHWDILCFIPLLASLVLGFSMFDSLCGLDLAWLHSTPIRPCSDVTIWEASPDVGFLLVCPSLFRSMR